MDISLVGSINIDLVYRVPYIVKNGETLHSASHSVHFGGKGSNQAVTASRLGANVHFIGKVGKDDFGEQAINNLKDRGVYIDAVQKEGATGQAIIQVTDAGDNAIVLFPGANFLVTSKQIEQEAAIISSSKVLLLQLEIPLDAVEKAVEIASQHGKIIILNPAPSQKLPDSLLKNITFLTPNETELAQITGIETTTEEDIRSACKLLLDKGVGTVIVTLGSSGSFYMTQEEYGWVQALSVDTFDTTGAGDAFNGALAVGLCRGDSLRSSISFATKVAAYVVTQMGAQPLIPASILK
ncbi:ribokinase [Lysinibacillus sp. CTST325]